VLVQVYACGFCLTDLKAITGARKLPMTDDHIIGHEPAGRVVALGRGVRGFQIGDRVAVSPLAYCGKCGWCKKGKEYTHYCEKAIVYGGDGPDIVKDGAFAQYIAVDRKSLYHIPKWIKYKDAALLEPVAGAWKGLHRARLKKGEEVVVIGPGGIGMLVATLAKKQGAKKVVAVDRSSYALEMATKLGIDVMINTQEVTGRENYDGRSFGKIVRAINYQLYNTEKPQSHQRPDIVVEAAGHISAARLMWYMMENNRGVRGSLFGMTTDEFLRFVTRKAHFSELELGSSFNVSRDSLEKAMAEIKDGFRPSRIVTHKYTLRQLRSAIKKMQGSDRLKVMIFPNPHLYFPN